MEVSADVENKDNYDLQKQSKSNLYANVEIKQSEKPTWENNVINYYDDVELSTSHRRMSTSDIEGPALPVYACTLFD